MQENSAETQDRTGDLQIFSLTLSQLNYRGCCAHNLAFSMRLGRSFVLGVFEIAVSMITYAMEVKCARFDSFLASGKMALQVAPLPPLSLSLRMGHMV